MKDYFRSNNKSYLVLNLYSYSLIQIKFEKYTSINYINLINNIFKILFKTIQNIHNYEYLHRDLKPSNICLDNNNEPYIIDFGLSKKYIINKVISLYLYQKCFSSNDFQCVMKIGYVCLKIISNRTFI